MIQKKTKQELKEEQEQKLIEDAWEWVRIPKISRRFKREKLTFPIFERILRITWGLGFWDIYHLFFYARRIPPDGTYLEIGSYKGGSLICAFEATRVAGISVCFTVIDPFMHRFENQFLENTEEIPAEIFQLFSDDAANEIEDDSVDLLFLDGKHTYDQVKRDIINYWPKLKFKGVFLGHDYGFWPEVAQAADELFGSRLRILPESRIFKVRKTKRPIIKINRS